LDHDHLPALAVLLFGAPLTLLVLAACEMAAARGWRPAVAAARRAAAAPRDARAAALLLLLAGWIHLGLVQGHADEPLFALLFLAAGLALLAAAAAALVSASWWRPAAALLAVSALGAYAATRLAALQGLDALGVTTGLLEAGALALALLRQPARLGAAHVH
jgi:hypothetical protein